MLKGVFIVSTCVFTYRKYVSDWIDPVLMESSPDAHSMYMTSLDWCRIACSCPLLFFSPTESKWCSWTCRMICSSCLLMFFPRLYVISLDGYRLVGVLTVSCAVFPTDCMSSDTSKSVCSWCLVFPPIESLWSHCVEGGSFPYLSRVSPTDGMWSCCIDAWHMCLFCLMFLSIARTWPSPLDAELCAHHFSLCFRQQPETVCHPVRYIQNGVLMVSPGLFALRGYGLLVALMQEYVLMVSPCVIGQRKYVISWDTLRNRCW